MQGLHAHMDHVKFSHIVDCSDVLSWVPCLPGRLMKAATDEWGTIDILVNVRSQLSHSITGRSSLLGLTVHLSCRLQMMWHTTEGILHLPA